jgi:SAM-dependent methyltransferase
MKVSDIVDPRCVVEPSFRGKHRIVASMLRGCRGTLLDVGARDRSLAAFLPNASLDYRSADRNGEHDFRIDLEQDLPFADRAFDYVVALDCLEHVEHAHQALRELLRISGRATIVALPNMASFVHRVSFLVRGRLATDKYDFPSTPREDRHRWLTVLPDTDRFVRAGLNSPSRRLTHIVHETEGRGMGRLATWAMLRTGLPLSRPWITRSIYRIEAVDAS